MKFYFFCSTKVGGPDRPPSKRMIQQMQLEEQEKQAAARPSRSQTSGSMNSRGSQQEGYFAYMQRQLQERTENLGIMNDNMDRLEDNSSGFVDDVNKFVKNQKKKAVLGGEYLT